METINSGLFVNNDLSFLESGDWTINGGNFSHDNIVELNITGTVVINAGNFSNVKFLSGDVTKNDGKFCHDDYCYWLHEDKELPVEIDNCRHVTSTDEIINDEGSTTIYHREDGLEWWGE